MDKQRSKESDKEAAIALSCHYVAKKKAPLSRISGSCEFNVNKLQPGMLVEANEVHADGGVRIRVHDDDNADVWRKTEWLCHKLDLASVPTLVWHFLAAVAVPQERVRIAIDDRFCQEANMLRVDDKVWYRVRRPDAVRCLAVIKYIGSMPDRGQGFYFGLELPDGNAHAQNFATKNFPGTSGNMTIATLDEICPLELEFSYKLKNNEAKKISAVENVCLPTDLDDTLTGSTANNRTINNSSVIPRESRVGSEARSSTFGDTNNNNNNNNNSTGSSSSNGNADTLTRLNNPLIPKVSRLSAKSKIVTNDTALLNPQNLTDSELIGNGYKNYPFDRTIDILG